MKYAELFRIWSDIKTSKQVNQFIVTCSLLFFGHGMFLCYRREMTQVIFDESHIISTKVSNGLPTIKM